jgi:hypothetical protein
MTVPMPLPAQLLQEPALRRRDEVEWSLAFDAAERGRRLTALRKATAGKELREIRPGLWEYVTVHQGSV